MTSELKQREEKLHKAHFALVQSEKMSAFGQLSAGLAHEVKNPLTGILGYAQLAKREIEPDNPIYENLEIIERETKRCRTIIDNLMSYTHSAPAEFEAIDINQVVSDTFNLLNHQLTIHGVKIKLTLVNGLSPIRGNANQLLQVLMNLLINAQQAMGGESGEVQIKTQQLESNFVTIDIKDNGPGIKKEIQSKIFEPLFTTKKIGEGTGLGLSVSYEIIKDHRGEIEIDSKAGKGTTFRILLPALK